MTLDKWRIRKGDQVYVTVGKDRGKIGQVLSVLRDKSKITVKNVCLVTRHKKPSASNASGPETKEMPIHVSNVMHLDPQDSKPTRIGVKFLNDGRKVRFAKRSGTLIDK